MTLLDLTAVRGDGDSVPGGLVEWYGESHVAAATAGSASSRPARGGCCGEPRPGRHRRAVQILCSVHVLNSLISSPWEVLVTFWQLTKAGTLPSDVGISLRRAGEGLLIGLSFGVVFGVISGLWKLGEDSSTRRCR